MQDYVPLKRVKDRREMLIFSAIIFIFIILICVIIFVSIWLNKKSKKEFLETSMFFVCANVSKNKKELENMQDNVKDFGGAGKIYQKDEFYYLIINSYFDKESAELVVNNNKKVYENIQILELKTKTISNKTRKKFKRQEINYKFLKKMNKNLSETFDLQMKFLSGEVTDNDLCSKLLTLKFDNDDLIDEIKAAEDNDYGDLVLNYANLEAMYFASFFNNFFESDKKSSVICEFVVSLALLKVDFFNNL
ncbi:MAG: hypothetical protein IJA23_03450 [Clostridia bacterium]|nr:hypothetical protein [Clostridia bacterium]